MTETRQSSVGTPITIFGREVDVTPNPITFDNDIIKEMAYKKIVNIIASSYMYDQKIGKDIFSELATRLLADQLFMVKLKERLLEKAAEVITNRFTFDLRNEPWS